MIVPRTGVVRKRQGAGDGARSAGEDAGAPKEAAGVQSVYGVYSTAEMKRASLVVLFTTAA